MESLIEMKRLSPDKLHVTNLTASNSGIGNLPRRYTLTHSDMTGDLYLTIGDDYDKKQISRLYTRLMRDEVLAELVKNEGCLELRVHCHVSGGLVVGTAKWRSDIFIRSCLWCWKRSDMVTETCFRQIRILTRLQLKYVSILTRVHTIRWKIGG